VGENRRRPLRPWTPVDPAWIPEEGALPGDIHGTTIKTTTGPVTIRPPKLRGTDEAFASRELAVTVPPGRTLVTLTSVSEDDSGEELSVIWEVEPGRAVIPSGALPDVPEPGSWDDPVLGALVDAVRWGTVASADVSTLQAPFRAGIQIKDYQLEPVARALRMPPTSMASPPSRRPSCGKGPPAATGSGRPC